MQWVTNGWMMLRRFGPKLGPYLILEIVMPGGTLLAVLLFFYQRRQSSACNGSRMRVSV